MNLKEIFLEEPDDSNPKNSQGENSEEHFNPEDDAISIVRKKDEKSLDRYVAFCLTSMLIFTAIVLFLFYFTSSEPSTLVTCFFAAFGGEVLCCALIKKFKLDKEKKDDEAG